jgi:hypothetical protein
MKNVLHFNDEKIEQMQQQISGEGEPPEQGDENE